jgi:hypothetical protein
VPEWKPAGDPKHQGTEACTVKAVGRAAHTGADCALLALADQLDSLLAELAAIQGLSDRLTIDALRRGPQPEDDAEGCDTDTSRAEAVLARLYPIELAILATPARTTADLGVKARHAAYVMSEHWEAPINQLDWPARTVRLLIEAVCNLAGTPLPFRGPSAGEAVRPIEP